MHAASEPATTSPQTLGFIGLGAMGAPMAARLARLGHCVLVHDINVEAVRTVVADGARAMSSAEAIGAEASVVLTCLPSLAALETVIWGAAGLHAGGALTTLVDLSTTGAGFARDMAARLHRRGIMMLDAPVTGNVTKAGNGQLGIMCSGPAAAFHAASPVLHDLARLAVIYLGDEAGKGQTMKSLNNLLSATGMAVSCEAFILGVKAGLDPAIILEVINAGDASSSATRNKFAKSVLSRRFDYGARMAITVKDVSTTVEEAEARGVPMWIGQSVRQIWKYAASQGGAEKDGTALITFLEPWAGVQIRATGANPTRPGLTEGTVTDALVLCDLGTQQALADRLRRHGWDVDARTGPGRAASVRRCTLVGVDPGQGADALTSLFPHARSDHPIAVNACLMDTEKARQVAGALASLGYICLDGLPQQAGSDDGSGQGATLAGGSDIAIRRAWELLEAFGTPVIPVSQEIGLAHLLRQIDGAVASTLWAAACEAFVAGAKAGLDPMTMSTIMGLESGRCAASVRIMPEQVATRAFASGKTLGACCRELDLLGHAASRFGVTPWVLDKTRLLYGLAAQLGSAQDDATRLANRYETWAGAEVRLPSPRLQSPRGKRTWPAQGRPAPQPR